MEIQKVSDTVIWTDAGWGNTVAIDIGDIYIIDACIGPSISLSWRKKVETQFKGFIKGLILTHHHFDHVGGNQSFVDVPIIATSTLREQMTKSKHEINSTTLKDQFEPKEYDRLGFSEFEYILPTICFESKLVVYGKHSRLEIIQTDGHTAGSSILYEPESKTIIAGDLVFNKSFPYAGDPTVDPYAWKKAMKEMINLKPKVIISGHGPIATVEDLKEILNFFEEATTVIEEKLLEGKSPEEITQEKDLPTYYLEEERVDRKRTMYQKWAELLSTK